MNSRSCVQTVAFVIGLSLLASCGGPKEAWVVPAPATGKGGRQVHITGVVRRVDLEGGFYAIQATDGVSYNPMNLPSEFQHDGMPVEADARRRDDIMSVHQAGPVIELERIRRRAGRGGAGVRPAGPGGELWGTAWQLDDLAGAAALPGVRVTLEFPQQGRASGNASCNRFSGSVTLSGTSITFGPLAFTRMACAEDVMGQEVRYLSALQGAQRYVVAGSTLSIYTRGSDRPLRFTRAQ